jgi:hypothetical protein
MTNCEKAIYDYIVERVADLAAPIDEKRLLRGIESYAEHNGLNASVPADGAGARAFLDFYLKPLDDMTAAFLLAYFCNHAKLAELTEASNAIFEAAKRRVINGEALVAPDYAPAYDRLQNLAAELLPFPEFRERVRREVSECALDVAAIEGRASGRSFRLGRFPGVDFGGK